jgi:hypothetical protein
VDRNLVVTKGVGRVKSRVAVVICQIGRVRWENVIAAMWIIKLHWWTAGGGTVKASPGTSATVKIACGDPKSVAAEEVTGDYSWGCWDAKRLDCDMSNQMTPQPQEAGAGDHHLTLQRTGVHRRCFHAEPWRRLHPPSHDIIGRPRDPCPGWLTGEVGGYW